MNYLKTVAGSRAHIHRFKTRIKPELLYCGVVCDCTIKKYILKIVIWALT
jgi:hypothetical protein